MICVQRGQRNTRLWIGPYGWMRFHRETLSVLRWFKPLSHDRDLGCHWEWKIPLVFVSLAVDAAVVCLQLSICQWLWCSGISPSSPLTLPHPFITHPSIYLLPPLPSIHPSIHPFLHVSPTGFQMFVSSLSPSTSLHPPPLWSPQKRLIQEGWAGVSELLLLCPMRCFHSTFLLLCCFHGPDMLTVQVAQSDVIQSYQLHKGCLFGSLKGHVRYLELRCHSCSVFPLTMIRTQGTSSLPAEKSAVLGDVFFVLPILRWHYLCFWRQCLPLDWSVN